jgi:hypothetical protein
MVQVTITVSEEALVAREPRLAMATECGGE